MGYCLSIFTILFLFFGILTQLIAYLTPYMHENSFLNERHGIFQNCINGKCRWYQFNRFSDDPIWFKTVILLATVSIAVVVLVVIFALINLIPRFKSRGLYVLIAIMLISNSILVAAVLTIYTTSNTIRFTGGFLHYSWAYWLLYGTIVCNLISAIYYCSSAPPRYDAKFN